MTQAEDPLWSQTDHSLLRAESLLQTCAAKLGYCRVQRDLDRERTQRGLESLRNPLNATRAELISLVEAMATRPGDGEILQWQARLQGQLTPIEHALNELDRWLEHLEAHQGSGSQ